MQQLSVRGSRNAKHIQHTSVSEDQPRSGARAASVSELHCLCAARPPCVGNLPEADKRPLELLLLKPDGCSGGKLCSLPPPPPPSFCIAEGRCRDCCRGFSSASSGGPSGCAGRPALSAASVVIAPAYGELLAHPITVAGLPPFAAVGPPLKR